ncbi:hypothetical protein HDU86_004126 [Geranomyces michiganensis]|nr:hypothetical protein HDU86_004126 [Geranomyces michiganensis]
MSLNGAIVNQDGTPVLVAGEKLFLNQPGVLMEYSSGNGYPGQGNNFYSPRGSLHLTNRRVIYITEDQHAFCRNLSCPLPNLTGGTLAQPWFQANTYTATVRPVPNGGLSMEGTVKFSFKQGGGFEFSSMFMQLRSREGDAPVGGEEPLPLYSPTDAGGEGSGPSESSSSSAGGVRLAAFPMPLPPAWSERPDQVAGGAAAPPAP